MGSSRKVCCWRHWPWKGLMQCSRDPGGYQQEWEALQTAQSDPDISQTSCFTMCVGRIVMDTRVPNASFSSHSRHYSLSLNSPSKPHLAFKSCRCQCSGKPLGCKQSGYHGEETLLNYLCPAWPIGWLFAIFVPIIRKCLCFHFLPA